MGLAFWQAQDVFMFVGHGQAHTERERTNLVVPSFERSRMKWRRMPAGRKCAGHMGDEEEKLHHLTTYLQCRVRRCLWVGSAAALEGIGDGTGPCVEHVFRTLGQNVLVGHYRDIDKADG